VAITFVPDILKKKRTLRKLKTKQKKKKKRERKYSVKKKSPIIPHTTSFIHGTKTRITNRLNYVKKEISSDLKYTAKPSLNIKEE
jgi:hypothetical protein